MPPQVTVRALTAVLGASPLALPAAPTDPRVDLTAATLGLTWAGGRMELAATALTAVGHAPGAGCGPGEGTLVKRLNGCSADCKLEGHRLGLGAGADFGPSEGPGVGLGLDMFRCLGRPALVRCFARRNVSLDFG